MSDDFLNDSKVIDLRRFEGTFEDGRPRPYAVSRSKSVIRLKAHDPITSGFLLMNWKRARRGWSSVPKALGIEHLADFVSLPGPLQKIHNFLEGGGLLDEFQEYRTLADEIEIPEGINVNQYSLFDTIYDQIKSGVFAYAAGGIAASAEILAMLAGAGLSAQEISAFNEYYNVKKQSALLKERIAKNRSFKPSDQEKEILEKAKVIDRVNDKRNALYGRYGARFAKSWKFINDLNATFDEAYAQCQDRIEDINEYEEGNPQGIAEARALQKKILEDKIKLQSLANRLISTSKSEHHRMGSGIFIPENHAELQKHIGRCIDSWADYQKFNAKKTQKQLLEEVTDSEEGVDKKFKDVLEEIEKVIKQDRAGKKIESGVMFKEIMCDPSAVIFTCGSGYLVKSGDKFYCVGGGKEDWAKMVQYMLKYIQDRDEWSTRVKIAGSSEFIMFAKTMLREYSFRWSQDDYGEGYDEVFHSYGDQIQNVQNKSTAAFEQGFWVETVAVFEQKMINGKLKTVPKMVTDSQGNETQMTMSIVAWDPEVVHTFGKDMPWTHFRNFACQRPPDYMDGCVRKNWSDNNKSVRQGVVMRFTRDGSLDESYLAKARLLPMTQSGINQVNKSFKPAYSKEQLLSAMQERLDSEGFSENEVFNQQLIRTFNNYLSGGGAAREDVDAQIRGLGIEPKKQRELQSIVNCWSQKKSKKNKHDFGLAAS